MTRIKSISSLIFILAFSFSAFTQIPDGFMEVANTKPLKNKITESAQQTQSLSSDFVQEKHLTMMEEVLVSKGRFMFRKENKVRWEYDSPINYTILINGNQFMIDNDGKISSFDTESNKMFREINRMILMAIQGNFVNDTSFIANYFMNDKYYLAELNPQEKILKNILSSIEIYFDKAGMNVDQIKFIEPEDDYTLIRFANRKKNINIPDEQFTLSK